TRMQQRMCRVAGLGRGPPMLARLSRESRASHIETRTPNERRKEPSMKKVLIGLMCALLASTASAASAAVVDWNIVGVITAQNVDNPVVRIVNNVPVGTVIHSGTFAWNTRSGHAHVNLKTGQASFTVRGLTINGTEFSGTPGPITEVTGTLVCNLGIAMEEA